MIRTQEIKEMMEYTRPDDLEIKYGVKDESDVLYSRDGKKLLTAYGCYTDDGIYHVKEGTEVICDKAFKEATSFDTIILPDTLTHIGAEAFHGNNLRSMVLPASLRYIGPGAFAYSRYSYGIESAGNTDMLILEEGIHCESARMFHQGKFCYVETMDGLSWNPYKTAVAHDVCNASGLKKESLAFRKKQKFSPYKFLSYSKAPQTCPCCNQVFIGGKPFYHKIWSTRSNDPSSPQWFCAHCGQPFYYQEMPVINGSDMVYLDYYFNPRDLGCKGIESVHIAINRRTHDCEAEYFYCTFDEYNQDKHKYLALPLSIPASTVEAILHPDTKARFQIAYPSSVKMLSEDFSLSRGLIEYRDKDDVYRLAYEDSSIFGIEYILEFFRDLCERVKHALKESIDELESDCRGM